MLVLLDEKDAPALGRRMEKSERRAFAERTLADFLAMAKPGDVFEVEQMPELDAEPKANADKVACALRTELFYAGRKADVTVLRRGARLFMRMEKPAEKRGLRFV